MPLWQAEDMLGMSRGHIRVWMGTPNGALKVSTRDYCKMWGKHGKPIPIVYAPSPLDVHMQRGRAPDRVWGTLWQSKGEMLPDDFEMRAERVPRWQPWRNKTVMRGWDWRCPGRAAANSERVECGRLCRYLYAPLPLPTLAQSICEWALEMPEDSGLSGAWHPGITGDLQQDVGAGRRSFACKQCWGVRNPSLLNHVGWNDFVTYISGGLLYGHEVERPLDEAPCVRKHAFGKRRSRKPPAGDKMIIASEERSTRRA